MLKLLQSIFASPSPQTNGVDESIIRLATERVVDGTDPRLRAVSGYRKKLRPAIERSVEYVIELVDDLPPPIDFGKAQFGTDARLRAFFASTDRLREVVNESEVIRSYLSRAEATMSDAVYALFGVEREERTVLGMDVHGDRVRRDVKQVVVNFYNHQFLDPTGDEDSTRWELKKRAFDHLIARALHKMVVDRKDRDKLAQERALLQRKLRALHSGDWGFDAILEKEQPEKNDTPEIETRIAAIEAELNRIGSGTVDLDDYLEAVAATLSEPGEHLHIRPVSLTLNQMSVKIPEGSDPYASTLSLEEVCSSDGNRALILLARLPRSEIQPAKDFLEEAKRYLS